MLHVVEDVAVVDARRRRIGSWQIPLPGARAGSFRTNVCLNRLPSPSPVKATGVNRAAPQASAWPRSGRPAVRRVRDSVYSLALGCPDPRRDAACPTPRRPPPPFIAIDAASAAARPALTLASRSRMGSQPRRAGVRHPLGDVFGLKNFGVNFTRMAPNAVSAPRHSHSRQDEFIYILEGNPVLITDAGETPLSPGMCAGFPAGGDAHHLVNRTDRDVVYLEVGDRTGGGQRDLCRGLRHHARRRRQAGHHPQGRHALLIRRTASTRPRSAARRRGRAACWRPETA